MVHWQSRTSRISEICVLKTAQIRWWLLLMVLERNKGLILIAMTLCHNRHCILRNTAEKGNTINCRIFAAFNYLFWPFLKNWISEAKARRSDLAKHHNKRLTVSLLTRKGHHRQQACRDLRSSIQSIHPSHAIRLASSLFINPGLSKVKGYQYNRQFSRDGVDLIIF